MQIHLSRCVAGEFLPYLYRYASIRHNACERKSKRVKTERIHAASLLALTFPHHFAAHLSALHNASERHRKATLAARGFTRERWKEKRLTAVGRWQFEKEIVERFVHWQLQALLCLARTEGNPFVLQIDGLPPHIRHVR